MEKTVSNELIAQSAFWVVGLVVLVGLAAVGRAWWFERQLRRSEQTPGEHRRVEQAYRQQLRTARVEQKKMEQIARQQHSADPADAEWRRSYDLALTELEQQIRQAREAERVQDRWWIEQLHDGAPWEREISRRLDQVLQDALATLGDDAARAWVYVEIPTGEFRLVDIARDRLVGAPCRRFTQRAKLDLIALQHLTVGAYA